MVKSVFTEGMYGSIQLKILLKAINKYIFLIYNKVMTYI